MTDTPDSPATIDREARVEWAGGLSQGSGRLGTPSGVGDGAGVSWARRTATGDGASAQEQGTSPEELIAAAHAACYSMALSHVLEQHGTPPAQLDVSARCLAEHGDALSITSVLLEVEGAVPGLDDTDFQRLAIEAERGCPVSNALRGNVEIRLSARLAA